MNNIRLIFFILLMLGLSNCGPDDDGMDIPLARVQVLDNGIPVSNRSVSLIDTRFNSFAAFGDTNAEGIVQLDTRGVIARDTAFFVFVSVGLERWFPMN